MSELILPVSIVAFAFLGAAYAAIGIWLVVQLFKGPERRAKWAIPGFVALPVLYVLSSGPMVSLAFRDSIVPTPETVGGVTGVAVTVVRDPGFWWPQIYAPLVWASDHSLGETLYEYWDLFPVQRIEEPLSGRDGASDVGRRL